MTGEARIELGRAWRIEQAYEASEREVLERMVGEL